MTMNLPEWSYNAEIFSVIDGRSLGTVESATVTADSGWSPRFQASVTVANYNEQLVSTYPGTAYVRLILTRYPGLTFSMGDWTESADLPGRPLSWWTLAGYNDLTRLTKRLGGTPRKPDVPAQDQETQKLELVLSCRDIQLDVENRTAELDLSSCEMDLQEIKNFTRKAIFAGEFTTVDEVVLQTLKLCGFTSASLVEVDLSGAMIQFNENGSEPWNIGESASDFLSRILEPYAAELWAESPKSWHLTLDSKQRWITGKDATPRVYATKITPHIRPVRGRAYVHLGHRSGTATGGGEYHQYIITGKNGVSRGIYEQLNAPGIVGSPGTTWTSTDTAFEGDGTELVREGSTHAQADIEAPADLIIRPDWRCDVSMKTHPGTLDQWGNPVDEAEFWIGDWHGGPGSGWTPEESEPASSPSKLTKVTWSYPEGTMQVETVGLGYPVSPQSQPPIYVP